jgi:hypothetical protein
MYCPGERRDGRRARDGVVATVRRSFPVPSAYFGGLERVQLQLLTFNGHRHGCVHPGDGERHLVHDFRDHWVDLARHDARSGLAGGSEISPSPACSPLESNRRSLQILLNLIAARYNTPERSHRSATPCVVV